ncbi:MAG: circumsporozoite protein- membrane associated protein, partial [Rubripirellula sp.]|nr:circumsporozoite protein- membrane associated protein [Rubripirellula sp.]
MATIAPPPTTSHQANPRPKTTPSGTDQLIDERIEEACRSLWWAELIRSGLKLVITTIIAILVWLVVDQWVYSPNVAVRSVVFVGLLGLAGWYLKVRVLPLFSSTVRPEYAARALERNLPELRQSLTSYVTLRSESNKTALQTRVVRSMGSVTAGRLRTYDEIPEEAAGNFRWWIATALVFALLLGYAVASPKNALHSVARLVAPIAEIDPARRVKITEVLPGNVEAMAGRKLQISAFVTGIREEEQITCRWDLPSGRQELALTFDPDSNRFAGELWLPHSASGAVSYTIQAGDASEGPYYLQVQDLPVVALQSVHYTPPKYTGQTSHTSSSGSIMGLAGTQVQILATTNRPVSIAQIEFSPRLLGDRVRATAGVRDLAISEDGTSLSFTFTLQTATGPSATVEQDSYRISVQDASGQGNSEPIIYPIRVVSDLPPEVSITMPFRSPKEMPIDAQQVIEVHASDPDYGLRHVRLEMRSGLDLMAEPILWSHPTGQKGNHVSEYRFRPAEHDLGIGSIVQIVAIATDNRESDEDANLESNVTRSDPIELKITAASTLPPPDDPNAGGLSAPDDRPASDHQKQPEEGADDSKGDQQEGGGGSGGSDASDSQGGNQQGGEGTSQEGGQSDKPSGDQQSGEGTSQEGGQSDKPSGD